MPSEEFRWCAIILVVICTMVFILQNIFPGVFANLVLTPNVLTMPWTLVTYIFFAR